MSKIILYIIIICLTSVSCNDKYSNPLTILKDFPLEIPDSSITNLEYSVYLSFFSSSNKLSNSDIIEQMTNNKIYYAFDLLKTEWSDLDLDSIIIFNYKTCNEFIYALDSNSINYESLCLISKNEVAYLTNNEEFNFSWDEYYKKYPNASGLWSFSRVGFNNDSTVAIVSRSFRQSFYRRDECYLLQLENNAWIIKWKEGIHTQN